MCALVGRLLGTAILARQDGDEAFSIPLWRTGGPSEVERSGFLGLVSAACLLLGALTPILGLATLCFTTSWIEKPVRDVLTYVFGISDRVLDPTDKKERTRSRNKK